MKKVLLIIDHSKQCGGGQFSLMENIRWQLALEVEYEIIVFYNYENLLLKKFLLENGINGYPINFKKNIFVKFLKIIKNFYQVRERKVKIYLYGNTFEGGFWCVILSKMFSTKFIFRARLSITDFNHGFVDRLIHSAADIILANSEYVKMSFIERFKISPQESKIHVVYNPLPKTTFTCEMMPKTIDSITSFNVAMIATIQRAKKQLELIKAFEIFADSFISGTKLFLIGAPDVNDNGSYYKELLEYVNLSKWREQILFVGFSDHVEEFYDKIHVVVNCTKGEALSRVMYESMFHGIPNIGSDSGGNRELIEDNVTGYLYQPGNYKDLSEVITRISKSPNQYLVLSKNAQKLIVEKFSLSNTCLKESEIISNLMRSEKNI